MNTTSGNDSSIMDDDYNNKSLDFCYNASIERAPFWQEKQHIVFWIEGVSLFICGNIGIVGNILTVIVLSKISLKNVFNQLIVTLCIVDTIFNALSVLEFSLKKGFALISWSTPIYVNLWPKVIFPLHNVTYSASLAITMAIAIERYLAVCHPFFIHQDHTVGTSRSFKKRTLRYLLPALFFAATINIPKLFEFVNYTRPDNVTYIKATALRMDADYQYYYINWFRTTLTLLLPFLLLSFLNGRIIFQIRKAEKLCAANATTASNAPASTAGSASKRETKLARILVLLVFTFLFCNLGKLFLNLYDIYNLEKLRICAKQGLIFASPLWVVALISLNHFLTVLNASTNLFLFSVIGTQFRATLLAILHIRPAQQGRAKFTDCN